jgi:signal transduction histidine kinase
MYNFLKQVPLFADLPEEDLRRLCTEVEEVQLDDGEILFSEGSKGDRAYIIRKGNLEVYKTSLGREVFLARREKGEVIGEMALLEETDRMASVRAISETELVSIRKEQLDRLMETSLPATRAMFYTVLARWRSTQGLLQQSEKMAQLGTLTAGVAHELNNPASAIKRNADLLGNQISQLDAAQAGLETLDLNTDEQLFLNELKVRVRECAEQPPIMDSLTRSDLEEKWETWLDDLEVQDGWQYSPLMAELDPSTDEQNKLLDLSQHENLEGVLRYLHNFLEVSQMTAEIHSAAGRISEIVKALKSYSYLDQAPMQMVDLHRGIDDTLLILRSKLREDIHIVRQYAKDLPQIFAHGSELNQVWTNLVDNAIDALPEGGQITIRTLWNQDWVVVEIEDSGTGIPVEIQDRIFDPFFTTKPVGKGTGLGLDIAYNIVVHKHHGDLKVTSVPGKTCFEVWLPFGEDQ